MEFLGGVAVNLVAETATRTFDSFRSEDKTPEYKESLANNINLVRAITHRFSKEQFTTENEALKKWYSDLSAAVEEGDVALQLATSDAKALKSAASKLENLTSKANTYLMLFRWEKKAATYGASSADVRVFGLADLGMSPVTAPWYTYDNLNPHPLSDLYKSEEEETLNSPAAPGNPGASQFSAPRLASDDSVLSYWHRSQSYFYERVKRAFELFDRKELETQFMDPYMMISSFDKEAKETQYMDQYMISSKLKQFYPGRKIPKMMTGGISKKRRGFIKNIEALKSMGLYPEGTAFLSGGFIYNGDHSINDRKKMKGKCPPECEFDEQTGYGKANMPTWSCFSSTRRGAGNRIYPSFDGIPEENDGYLSRAGTSDDETGYGDASMPAISCFPSSSSGGVGNHINPSSDVTPDKHDERVGDVLKSFDGTPE